MRWDTRKHHATKRATKQIELIHTISWILTVGEGSWVSERVPSWDACHKVLKERKQKKKKKKTTTKETYRCWLSCSLSIPRLQLPQLFPPSWPHMQTATQLNGISLKWRQFHSSMCQGRPQKERDQGMEKPSESIMMATSGHGPPPAPNHLTYILVNKILGDDDGRREEWHSYYFIQNSLHLPFSPIMEDASFLLSRFGDFLYSKAWQFWSMERSVSKKGLPAELKSKPVTFV